MINRFFYFFLVLPLALPIAWGLALFHPNLRRALVGRLRAAPQRAPRDPARPLVWFHVASAGELLQAEPLLRRFRERGAQLAVTLSSASGLVWLERLQDWPELVWAGLLPIDFPRRMERLLESLRPSVLVYLQADLWPGLVWGAARRGVPQVLVAARVGGGSNWRGRFPLNHFFRDLYGHMETILAVSPAEQVRIARIVPGHPRLEVGGDPGIETVLARLAEAPEPLAGARFSPGNPVLVAGSTWPADEQHLLPVLNEALERIPEFRAIIVPHEPGEAHLQVLENALPGATARLSVVERADPPPGEAQARVILVDSVGRLASLYKLGTVAYVGGGFSSGVHNVAEPAACGLPVLFGPRHDLSTMAQTLLDCGAARAVGGKGELREHLIPLLEEPGRRAEMGARARAAVDEFSGAAERCFQVVAALVPGLEV